MQSFLSKIEENQIVNGTYQTTDWSTTKGQYEVFLVVRTPNLFGEVLTDWPSLLFQSQALESIIGGGHCCSHMPPPAGILCSHTVQPHRAHHQAACWNSSVNERLFLL